MAMEKMSAKACLILHVKGKSEEVKGFVRRRATSAKPMRFGNLLSIKSAMISSARMESKPTA